MSKQSAENEVNNVNKVNKVNEVASLIMPCSRLRVALLVEVVDGTRRGREGLLDDTLEPLRLAHGTWSTKTSSFSVSIVVPSLLKVVAKTM